MMPLSMANQGEPNIIKKVGGKDDVRSFLEKLGFVVGGIPAWLLVKRWLTRLWFSANPAGVNII